MAHPNIPFHEVAEIFPLMLGKEFVELKEDIRTNGLREPIWLHQGQIIDGRNRFRACQETGAEPVFREWDGNGSLVAFVISLNLHRRHLNSGQKAACALEALPLLEAEAKKRMAMGGGDKKSGNQKIDDPIHDAGQALDKAAKHFDTNRQYVSDAKKIKAENPALFEQIKSGEVGIVQAIQETRRAEVKKNLESIETKQAKALSGQYDVIVIDPPWAMEKIERDERQNQVGFDYPTMSESELSALNIPAADDCHLWLWTTHKFLPMALRLLDAWNFKYVCTFVWHKPGGFQPFGLPQYNCEFAIYARKGAPKFIDMKAFPVCFNAPRGAHSEKPEEFYEVVRRVTAGRRIDMFGRRAIDGFDSWGKEAAA